MSIKLKTKPGRRSFRISKKDELDFVATGRAPTLEYAAHIARVKERRDDKFKYHDIKSFVPNGTEEEELIINSVLMEDRAVKRSRRRAHWRSKDFRYLQLLGLRLSNVMRIATKSSGCKSQIRIFPFCTSTYIPLVIASSDKSDKRRIVSVPADYSKDSVSIRSPDKAITVKKDKGITKISINVTFSEDEISFIISNRSNGRIKLGSFGNYDECYVEDYLNTKYVDTGNFEFLWKIPFLGITEVHSHVEYAHPVYGRSKIQLHKTAREAEKSLARRQD